MDFGKMLNDWDKIKSSEQRENKEKQLTDYIDKYPPNTRDRQIKEKGTAGQTEDAIKKREEIRKMKPQREIDLHRLRVSEAIERVEAFIRQCKNDNIKKALIIHGKGRHSQDDPVLGKKVVQFVRNCPFTGEYGTAPKELGGSGALWVIIR